MLICLISDPKYGWNSARLTSANCLLHHLQEQDTPSKTVEMMDEEDMANHTKETSKGQDLEGGK